MTREDAILCLKGIKKYGRDTFTEQSDWQESLDMAIKALEQEPTTKNDLGVDREDAVERLNAIKQLIGYDKDSEIVKATQKSLDMAIKALEHPEKNVVAVVPCGDCISRTEVLKLIYDYKEKHSENHKEYPINYGTLLDMIRWVRDLPSVTPIKPKGHWIDTNNLDVKYKAIYMCSNCRSCYTEMKPINMNFCPNCGTDMREVEK